MGITSITSSRILEGQMRGESGEENVLSWEKFPWSAQAKTYNVNSQGADSGACATAFLCGVKTNQGRQTTPHAQAPLGFQVQYGGPF